MASLETQQVDAIIDSSRRKMLTVGGAALAGIAFASLTPKAVAAVSDTDILNFALNLEYLEAQFYNLAATGTQIQNLSSPISISGGNGGTAGTVTTKPNFAPVPFTNSAQDMLIKNYATEVAKEEANHVSFLSTTLASAAVPMPNIDLYNSFNTLATAAGLPSPFDPFASSVNFLLGAYIFEDVGVSAYHGAAGLISSKTYLGAAVAIHAVEAYHAGLIRTTIASIDAANLALHNGAAMLSPMTVQISALRAALSLTGSTQTPATPADDVGVSVTSVALEGSAGQYSSTTIVDADANSIGWARTTTQVLAIVTAGNANNASGTPANSGLFFPNGLNGNIN
jgi:hypothetical protein